MKRKSVRPYTEERTRNTDAVWLVTDASDRLDVDTDELVDFDGLGREGTDPVTTGRVGSVVTVTMTGPECLQTTATSAQTQHHCQSQGTDALA